MKRHIWVLVLLSVLPIGCTALPEHPRTYTAWRAYLQNELAVGDRYRDFVFTDAAGRITRLSAVHGRVTVLAFPNDPDWPNCADVQRLVEIAARSSTCFIDVVFVLVAHPARPCPEALAAGAECVASPEHVALVCDPYGWVAPLYGSGAAGQYYVLTNFLDIAAIGELSDEAELQADIHKVVADIYDQDYREGAYDRYRGWD